MYIIHFHHTICCPENTLGFDSPFLFLDPLHKIYGVQRTDIHWHFLLDPLNKIYGVLMFTGISDGVHDLWRTGLLAPALNQPTHLDMAQAW
jgi:hypothetical protein